MRPDRAGNNLFDKGQAHAKHVGKLPSRGASLRQFPNAKNVLGCQLGAWIRFAKASVIMAASILGVHVCAVITMRAKEKMFGIDARRIIAFVADQDSFGDRAIVQLVGVAMGKDGNSAGANASVVATLNGTCPHPAGGLQNGMDGAVLVHLLPKALFGGWEFVSAPSMTKDKAFGLTLDPSVSIVCSLGNWGRLAASAFTKFLSDFLCVHRCNYTTFCTNELLQFLDNSCAEVSCI